MFLVYVGFPSSRVKEKRCPEEPDDLARLTAYNVFETTLEILYHRVGGTVCFLLSGKIF
jgi:hypothetical protein